MSNLPTKRAGALAVIICATLFVMIDHAAGQIPSDDATSGCEWAAVRAERDWRLPRGILAAIGIVESGRPAPVGAFPIIWPWTISAEGQSFYQPSKIAAIATVRALRLRGVRVIDVGCFQVDLFYHPYAFAGLEEAFDPEANASAAARILSLGRLSSSGWNGAIAAYHSAATLTGAMYSQKVRAVWPWIRTRPLWGQTEAPAAYAVMLSPQARLVRLVMPLDPAVDLRVTGARNQHLDTMTVQQLRQPNADLPRVLTPFGSN